MMGEIVNGILRATLQAGWIRSEEVINIDMVMEEFRSNGRDTPFEPVMTGRARGKSLYPCLSHSSSPSNSSYAGGNFFIKSSGQSLKVQSQMFEQANPKASGLWSSSNEKVRSLLSKDDAPANFQIQQGKETSRFHGTTAGTRRFKYCENNDMVMEEFRSKGRNTPFEPEMTGRASEKSLYPCSSHSSSPSNSSYAGGNFFIKSSGQSLKVQSQMFEQANLKASGLWSSSDEKVRSFLSKDDAPVANFQMQQVKETSRFHDTTAGTRRFKYSENKGKSYSENLQPDILLPDMVMEEFRSNGRETPIEPEMIGSASEESLYSCSSHSSSPSNCFYPGGNVFIKSSEQSLEVQSLTSELANPKNSGLWPSLDKLDDRSFLSTNDAPVANRQIHQIGKKSGLRPRKCTFCFNNGESDQFYSSHYLHGRDSLVTCPVLAQYVCPICGATGCYAHTINYCPSNKNKAEVAEMNVLRMMRSSTGKYRNPNQRC